MPCSYLVRGDGVEPSLSRCRDVLPLHYNHMRPVCPVVKRSSFPLFHILFGVCPLSFRDEIRLPGWMHPVHCLVWILVRPGGIEPPLIQDEYCP